MFALCKLDCIPLTDRTLDLSNSPILPPTDPEHAILTREHILLAMG